MMHSKVQDSNKKTPKLMLHKTEIKKLLLPPTLSNLKTKKIANEGTLNLPQRIVSKKFSAS